MEICIVCCKSSEDEFARIMTLSTEWKEWNIQHIIEKHLWWWYLKPTCSVGMDHWICSHCWKALSSFHNFYLKVEKEHKLLLSLLKCTKKEEKDVDVKMEAHNPSLSTEDYMLLDAPKRGRKRKAPMNAESVVIQEFPIVDVKYENDNPEDIKSELNVNIFANDEDVHPDFFNDEECMAQEDNEEQADYEDDKLNFLLNKRTKRKVKSKSKIVGKYKKIYAKTKKDKKIKVEQKSENSSATQAMRKNDQFLADQFQLSCYICNISLDNFNSLKIHFRKEHNTLGYAMCCSKKFYKRGLLVDHLNVHKNPDYFKCLQCNKPLSTRRSYEKHMETHQLHETRPNLFTCDQCDKSFLKKTVFERHVLTHVPEEERNYQCSMCDKKFASEYLQKQHSALTHSKKYARICDICGKLLRDSFSFINHMAEHKGETPAKVECEICGAQLTNKYRLNRHKKMMHTEENQQEQVCPYCSKVSPNLNAHQHHVKYTHTLERKHACNMCDKKFRRPLELKEHLSTHTGEPLYTCPHCPRTFISSANMHKHRKLTHHKEWEEGRLKKEAKALAGKKFLKTLNATQNETSYSELEILDPGNDPVPNLAVLNFL